MNSYIKVILILVLVNIAGNLQAQRWKNDPSHSPHNYKHPNKAAEARLADTVGLQERQFVEHTVAARNYKSQNRAAEKEVRLGNTFDSSENTRQINRNYKQQFVSNSDRRKQKFKK